MEVVKDAAIEWMELEKVWLGGRSWRICDQGEAATKWKRLEKVQLCGKRWESQRPSGRSWRIYDQVEVAKEVGEAATK